MVRLVWNTRDDGNEGTGVHQSSAHNNLLVCGDSNATYSVGGGEGSGGAGQKGKDGELHFPEYLDVEILRRGGVLLGLQPVAQRRDVDYVCFTSSRKTVAW